MIYSSAVNCDVQSDRTSISRPEFAFDSHGAFKSSGSHKLPHCWSTGSWFAERMYHLNMHEVYSMECVTWPRFCFVRLTHAYSSICKVLTGSVAHLETTVLLCIPLVRHLWRLIYDLVMDTENVRKWDTEPLKEPAWVELTRAEEPKLGKITWQPCLHHCLPHNDCQKLDIFTVLVLCVCMCGCMFVI